MLRFARCLIGLLREAPKSLLSVHSIVLPCSSVRKTLDCLLGRGELTPVACTTENLHSPERPRVMTVTATRPEGHSYRVVERSLKIRNKLRVKDIDVADMPCRPKPKSMRWRKQARLKWVIRCADHRQATCWRRLIQ